jgi:hypothetical protein
MAVDGGGGGTPCLAVVVGSCRLNAELPIADSLPSHYCRLIAEVMAVIQSQLHTISL